MVVSKCPTCNRDEDMTPDGKCCTCDTQVLDPGLVTQGCIHAPCQGRLKPQHKKCVACGKTQVLGEAQPVTEFHIQRARMMGKEAEFRHVLHVYSTTKILHMTLGPNDVAMALWLACDAVAEARKIGEKERGGRK